MPEMCDFDPMNILGFPNGDLDSNWGFSFDIEIERLLNCCDITVDISLFTPSRIERYRGNVNYD